TSFITTEYKIWKWKIAPIDILLLVFTIVFGLMLRSKVWMINGPYDVDVNLLGGMADPMLSVSISADILMAALGGIYVFLLTGAKRKGYLTYSVLFLSPVTAMGSAMAKSGDGIWLSFMLLAFIFAFRKNRVPAIISALLAAACSPYILTRMQNLPLFLSTVSRLINAYRPQKLLSYHFPNVYQLIGPDAFVPEYEKVGLALTLAAAVALLAWARGYLGKNVGKSFEEKTGNTVNAKQTTGSDETSGDNAAAVKLLTVVLFVGWVLTYICPGMDERAGLMTMVLSLCFVMAYPKYYYLAIVEMILDFLPGAAFFRGESFLPLSWAAMIRLLMILYFYSRVIRVTKAGTDDRKDKDAKDFDNKDQK
ncbi:MAG: hypothetical protein IK078_04225, partial [Lachnospiraceae bacterium]|nr:hypothetical protein [Lachnospiraceae bacterium]